MGIVYIAGVVASYINVNWMCVSEVSCTLCSKKKTKGAVATDLHSVLVCIIVSEDT